MKKFAKKIFTAAALTAMIFLSAITVSAEHYWTCPVKFTAANGTVTVDGKIDPGEWDDAQAISVKLNNDPLDAQGYINYQGEWQDPPRDDADYSGTYKVKWDNNNIYFLEDRNDNYVNLFGTGNDPYWTDGTLVFTQVDSADGKLNPDGISIHAFYSVGLDGKIGGDLKARVANMSDASRETVDIPGGKISSALKTGGFIIEAAIPWSFYTLYIPNFKGPTAGDIMGISYVIHDSDTDDVAYVKQLCYAIDNDNLSDVPGGYDFGSWATLELLAASSAAAPAAPAAPAATGFTTAGDAAAGKNIISGAQFIAGGDHFGDADTGEKPANLFDGDTATKYCAGDVMLPYWVTWKYDQTYTADRLILATANDNASNAGRRMADGWTLSGSNDGNTWTVIYTGKANDVADVDFTYFGIDLNNSVAYQYYKIEGASPVSGTVIQYSEVALCGTAAGAAPAAAAPAAVAAAPAAASIASASPAPTTGDSSIIFIFASMILSAGASIIIITKRRSVKIK